MKWYFVLPLAALLTVSVFGCGFRKKPFSITAVRLSPGGECEPQGIPYYLPKPLLIVARNARHIDESKVGLTGAPPIPGGFDNQAAYADIKANVTVPGTDGKSIPAAGTNAAAPTATQGTESKKNIVDAKMTPGGRMDDGITPDSFYTYQIVFVPDLSQKYGLKMSGGPGEVRAAMNMVNGWMYTGMGPYYLKDSSTAQNSMACGVAAMFAGRGAADVLNEVGEIAALRTPRGSLPGGAAKPENVVEGNAIDSATLLSMFNRVMDAAERENLMPKTMLNYAEIYIYEPELTPDGQMIWDLIAEHHFDRQYFAPNPDKPGAARQMMPLLDGLIKQSIIQASNTSTLPGGDSDTPAAEGNPENAQENVQENTQENALDQNEDLFRNLEGIDKAVQFLPGGALPNGITAEDIKQLNRHFSNADPATPVTAMAPTSMVTVNVGEQTRQIEQAPRKGIPHFRDWLSKRRRPVHRTRTTDVSSKTE